MLMPEAFIAWRYLYKRRSSRVLQGLTVLALLLFVGVQVAFFGFNQANVGAILTIPTALFLAITVLLNFLSVFTTISVVGIILGVAALTVVLSVTSGFQEAFREKILGVNSHVLVMKYGLDFSEYRHVMDEVSTDPDVKAASPFVFNQMMLARGPVLSGVLLKGIDPVLSPKVLDIAHRLRDGVDVSALSKSLPANDGGAPIPAIFIGQELQKKLRAKIGDRVRAVSPKIDADPSEWQAGGEGPAAREFRVAGVFYSGFDEYDRRLAYVNLPEAQAFYNHNDIVTGVEMRVAHIEDAEEVGHRLLRKLGGAPYRVIDWQELNHNIFTALKTQKVIVVILMTLIILVAAFNIVAAMTMMVVEKTKEVAILASMGMSSLRLAAIFQFAGVTIGILGTAFGIGLGLLCCQVVTKYGYSLDAKVYLIDQLPVKITLVEMLLTAGITLGIALLSTVYPAWKASSVDPVEGLRWE